MNAQTTITAAEIQLIALANLSLSPINPRQDVTPAEIEIMAKSLKVCGLIQNLAGFARDGGPVEIVAGGRRLRALQLLANQGVSLDPIAVIVTNSEAQAEIWANAENTARADLHPADEIRAYGRMIAQGASLAAVASAFAVTEAHVRRRAKLAQLPAPILDALKAGSISLGHAALFTLCEDESRQLEVLEAAMQRDLGEHYLRQLLQDGQVRATDRRAQFVGLDTYQTAGGHVTRDLFSEDVFLGDAALLQRLFTEALDQAAAAAIKDGWKWAEVTQESYLSWEVTEKLTKLAPTPAELTEDEAQEYDDLTELAQSDELDEQGEARLEALDALFEGDYTAEQRGHAGGYVYVNREGVLTLKMGYLRREDEAEAAQAGVIEAASVSPTKKAETAKSPYSAALVEDLRSIRLAAVQAALLDKPDLVLDLLAFALAPESGAFNSMFAIRTSSPKIVPSKEDGVTIDERLASDDSHRTCADLSQAFATFQAQSKKQRSAALTQAVARTLNYGCTDYVARPSTLFNQIEQDTGANVRKVWTPTATNFFGRVSAGYLDALLLDLLQITGEDDRARAFTKLKKAEKAETMERLFNDADTQTLYKLDKEGRDRIAGWTPTDAF